MSRTVKIITGFSRPKGRVFPFFAWLIQWFFGINFNHVYLRWFSVGANVDVAYEANSLGVNFRAKWYMDKYIEPVYEYECEIDMATYKRLLNFCMSNAGRPYSIKQVINIATIRWFKRSFFKTDGEVSQICTEVVGYVLRDLIGENITIDLEHAGPNDLREICEASEHFKRIL